MRASAGIHSSLAHSTAQRSPGAAKRHVVLLKATMATAAKIQHQVRPADTAAAETAIADLWEQYRAETEANRVELNEESAALLADQATDSSERWRNRVARRKRREEQRAALVQRCKAAVEPATELQQRLLRLYAFGLLLKFQQFAAASLSSDDSDVPDVHDTFDLERFMGLLAILFGRNTNTSTWLFREFSRLRAVASRFPNELSGANVGWTNLPAPMKSAAWMVAAHMQYSRNLQAAEETRAQLRAAEFARHEAANAEREDAVRRREESAAAKRAAEEAVAARKAAKEREKADNVRNYQCGYVHRSRDSKAAGCPCAMALEDVVKLRSAVGVMFRRAVPDVSDASDDDDGVAPPPSDGRLTYRAIVRAIDPQRESVADSDAMLTSCVCASSASAAEEERWAEESREEMRSLLKMATADCDAEPGDGSGYETFMAGLEAGASQPWDRETMDVAEFIDSVRPFPGECDECRGGRLCEPRRVLLPPTARCEPWMLPRKRSAATLWGRPAKQAYLEKENLAAPHRSEATFAAMVSAGIWEGAESVPTEAAAKMAGLSGKSDKALGALLDKLMEAHAAAPPQDGEWELEAPEAERTDLPPPQPIVPAARAPTSEEVEQLVAEELTDSL